MSDIIERARRYISKCPPAVSGQNGHAAAFNVAVALVHGFCLQEMDALRLFGDYNAMCQPPWTEAEMVHKIRSAATTAHDKPRGYLLGTGNVPTMPQTVTPRPATAVPVANYPLPDVVTLPTPLPDGARALLRAAFQAGEGIRIVAAKLNEEGREVPDGEGPTLSREEWLRKLDARGGEPNGIWKSEDRTGIYIAVNPLKLGCNKDADVTAFRHTLIEFDGISVEEQWSLYRQSNIPCTAVISSGGKSVHAWVRVDARDRKEFDERVRILHEHFAAYGIDGKNKNPSRLSRLPNCERFTKRQELLAVNCGAPSFESWLADKEVAGIGEEITLGQLLDFDPDNDPNSILGKRWLCKGGSCLWIGQSGVGKSALAIQAAILWALARSFFGIAPAKPLKSLFIQHENDVGDLSEMVKGVLLGMGLLSAENAAEVARTLKERIVIIRERTHTGKGFLSILQRLIEKHGPDLVWIDPLYTYVGDDISSQKVCSEFLCDGLGPITSATGVVWMMMHHTGKPSKDPKARKRWTATDYSYEGLGSSILTNWVRASATMVKVDEETFKLMLGKRGKRAGATDLHGGFTTNLFLRHSQEGICWCQVDEPTGDEGAEKAAKADERGRPKSSFDFDGFIDSIANEHFTVPKLAERAAKFSGMSERTIYRRVMPELKARLKLDPEFQTYSP